MMNLLLRLEESGLSTWLRESQSIMAFPFVLALHTFGLGIVVGCTVMVDLRLLGGASHIALKPLEKFFSLMWIGFAVNAVSGVMLFAKEATTVSISVVFWVKMTMIALAMWTVTRIRAKVFDDPLIDTHPVSPDVKRLALASIVLWAAAITAGRLLAYVGPTQPEAGILFGSQ